GTTELGLKLADLALGADVSVLFRPSRAEGDGRNSRRQDHEEASHDQPPFSHSAQRRMASRDVECFTMLMSVGSARGLTGTRFSFASRSGRQGESGSGAHPDGALHLDRSPVGFGDRPCDGEAQTGALHLPVARRVDAVEPLEDMGKVFRRYADSRILDN